MNKTVKQDQTHQVLTNMNNLTEMNRQFLKIETTQSWTTESKHQHKNKNKLRKLKENYEWTKDYFAITKKHWMEKNQDGNGKK